MVPVGSLAKTCSAVRGHGRRMECGAGVPLCGILTLETGRGVGAYHHNEPVVHGLWPQVARYGTSQCLLPQETTSPSSVASCYKQDGEPYRRQLGFERHEW